MEIPPSLQSFSKRRRKGIQKHARLMVWVILGAALKILAASPQEPSSLSLSDAVQMALQQNPALEEARSRSESAAARSEQARSQRLPGVGFGEAFTHGNNPVYVFGTLLEQGKFGSGNFALDSLNNPASYSNFRSTLDLSLPVFNRHQTSSLIRQADLGEQQAQAQMRLTQQQVRFEAVRHYYGVQLARKSLETAQEAVRAAEADVERLQNLFEQGMVVASDLLAMKVQLAEFRHQQVEAEGMLAKAFASLNNTLGQPVGWRPDLTVQLEERAFSLPPADDLIQQTLQGHPDYQTAQLEMEKRRQEVRAARGGYLPDFSLFAEYGNSSQDLSSGSSDFTVGAKLRWQIIDFGRSARVREAAAALDAARARQRQVADALSLQVYRALQDFRTAQERLEVSRGVVEQGREALRITRDRYEAGLTDVTELLRAQTALVRALLDLQSSRYGLLLGYAQVLLASGQLEDIGPFE